MNLISRNYLCSTKAKLHIHLQVNLRVKRRKKGSEMGIKTLNNSSTNVAVHKIVQLNLFLSIHIPSSGKQSTPQHFKRRNLDGRNCSILLVIDEIR